MSEGLGVEAIYPYSGETHGDERYLRNELRRKRPNGIERKPMSRVQRAGHYELCRNDL